MKFNEAYEYSSLMTTTFASEKRKVIDLKKRFDPKNITDTGFPDLSGTSDTSGYGNACLGPKAKGITNDGSYKI